MYMYIVNPCAHAQRRVTVVVVSVCLSVPSVMAGLTVTKRRIQIRNHEFLIYYELKSVLTNLKLEMAYDTDTTFTYIFRKRYSQAESRVMSQRVSSTRAISWL